ncbi:MAG: hypothetical protein IJT35_03950 [Paludibacteraceae bacterium]|nr:hypothetical protein [Paludibacteraceae bacterium]
MKKAFLCFVFQSLSLILTAQDIIITNDAKKIESTILEVSKTEIRYKETANPNGPTFVLSTAEISSIIYANGQTQVFSSSTPDKHSPTHSSTSASADSTPSPISTSKQTTEKNMGKGRIFRDNNEYMYNDIYISSKEVERILKRENSSAYAKWRQGKGMKIGGAVCSGIGGGLIFVSLCCIGSNTLKGTLVMDGVGIAMIGVGLGVSLGANGCYNKAIDIYNSTYDETAMRLNFIVDHNGVGFALNF